MNTKKEIVKFLEELLQGVEGKLKNYHLQGADKETHILHDSFSFTEGQDYEIHYIVDTLTRDRRKKI